jgi:membrane protein
MGRSLLERFDQFLWGTQSEPESLPLRILRTPARFVYALVRDLLEGQLTLRAMSLVYTTLLSVVPLLAFSFAVLKGFGVHRELEPRLYEFLYPLGEQGAQITKQVIDFVDNVKGGALGGVGLSLLIFTVISMVQKIEDALNFVWMVQRSRSLARRFSDYLSVILVGPILMVTAFGLMATVSSSEIVATLSEIGPIGTVIAQLGRLVPFAIVVLVFTFLYKFLPNTRVNLFPAFMGAVAGGAFWAVSGALFAEFVVGSTRYAAIYSGFAIGLIALIWLYVSWLVLLLGAQISFYVQNPRALHSGRSRLQLTVAQTEELALSLMYRVGRAFRAGTRIDHERLARELSVPARALGDVVERLEKAHLLVVAENGGLLPARDMGCIELEEILDAVRGRRRDTGDEPVQSLMVGIRKSVNEGLRNRHLSDLVEEPRPEQRPAPRQAAAP